MGKYTGVTGEVTYLPGLLFRAFPDPGPLRGLCADARSISLWRSGLAPSADSLPMSSAWLTELLAQQAHWLARFEFV